MSATSQEFERPVERTSEINNHELQASTCASENHATQQIYQSKTARKTAKAGITRKINEITELIKDRNNAQRVQSVYCEFEEAIRKFLLAHENHQSKLTDEDDVQESEAYCNVEIRRASVFRDKIRSWLEVNSSCQTNGNDLTNEIKPSDSVSNIGTDFVSKTSHKSKSIRSEAGSFSSRGSSKGSVVSAKAAAAAVRKATLEEEAKRLHRRQEIQQRELRLKQQREELELETKIAQAAAKERTYSEIGASRPENATFNPCNEPLRARSTKSEVLLTSGRPREEHSKPNFNVQNYPSTPLYPHAIEWNSSGNYLPTLHTTQQDTTNYLRNTEVENERLHAIRNEENRTAVQATNPPESQHIPNTQLIELLAQQQQHTLALTLPSPKVPIFNGNPIDFSSFIQAFEQLIESKTKSSSARLYYLVQYTSGDVQELMRSCLLMNPEEGYQEARRLLKTRYGRNYQIAAAYVERITSYPQIRSEDGESLQRFSVLLTSCKNTLKQIGYLNKIENPDSLQRIMEKLPFGLRQKWRDVADEITEVKQREITIEDVALFVEKRARACNHPLFGKISKETKTEKPSKNVKQPPGSSFATKGNENSSHPNLKCPLCNNGHWLSQCSNFRSKPIEERFKLVRSLKLCDNCLTSGHIARSCDKKSFCKIEGCKFKHSTFLHRKPCSAVHDQLAKAIEQDGCSAAKRPPEIEEKKVQNGYVNVGEKRCEARRVTGLPVVPVKVKAKGFERTVETYAFLDGGSNTSFITESLLKQLGARGSQTTLSLTTMQKERSQLRSSVISLEVGGLDGQKFIDLPTVFSVSKLPVSREDIPRQSDVDRWPHLQGIVLTEIDADVGLLIGNDVPKVLQPQEVRGSDLDGPYAMRTALGWTVNGPLGRDGVQELTANFIQADTELDKSFKQFFNQEFNEVDDEMGMSCLDKRALRVMEDTIRLKNGHYELALPWKNPPPSLPNNKPLAERRLKILKKRLEKDDTGRTAWKTE